MLTTSQPRGLCWGLCQGLLMVGCGFGAWGLRPLLPTTTWGAGSRQQLAAWGRQLAVRCKCQRLRQRGLRHVHRITGAEEPRDE